MELRRYWAIILRWWWIVAVITGIALVAAVALRPEARPTYKITVKLAIRPTLEPRGQSYYGYDEYYAYVASEYLVDDIGEVVKGGDFMADLRNRLKDRPGGPPSGYIEARKAHRVLTLTITAGSAQEGIDIANETAKMLTEGRSKYIQSLSNQDPTISVVDPPSVAISPAPARDAVDIGLRTSLGLITGLMLAFLMEYLDTSVRGSEDIASLLGLPVVGEIPRDNKRRRVAKVA
jgi:capsular polysaccharide biosynthesis protein